MILSPEHAQEFLNLYKPLLQFIFLKEFREEVKSLENYIEARDILFEDTNVVNEFISSEENINKNKKIILKNIQNGIKETFIYLKTLKRHSLLLSSSSNLIYCVLGITDAIEQLIPDKFSIIDTAILNFGNKIICDGLIRHHNVTIGKNMRKDISLKYKLVRENNQLIKYINRT
jgi:hypothetical protein